ncbi:hypothetical protein ASA1KI_21370 [Opitutales bacterium ASA1]|uniref:hypothetical protein n=1 Tax=Congregicoccus parvus TaxID=3081749 RepID=UPI002B301337|nr:hypothetical protein ASA1KI_21370 [Opitutales bacterium ASA1]
MKPKFTASLSPGRNKWCVIFRHPLILDPNGKPGRRIRAGLGTDDRSEAEQIVADLNSILSNRDLWSPASKVTAQVKYHERAVSAFFENERIQSVALDPWAKRDEVLPIPTDGFSIAQFTGPTGVGKTTLARQLLGTGPRERFPSTSTSRTTIFDTEIIFAPGDYEAVVSFISRDRARSYVEECVEASVMAFVEGLGDQLATRRFLEHTEQRFRLSYMLGTLSDGAKSDDDDEDAEPLEDTPDSADFGPDDSERVENRQKLSAWLERCREAAGDIIHEIETEVGEPVERLGERDKDAFMELVEGALYDNEEIHSIADEILDEIESKFVRITEGDLDRDQTAWPVRWRYGSSERATFLRQIGRFASNYAPHFGRLLTPLVEGMRVKGPFKPAGWAESDDIPMLVLLDGEGLGHHRGTAAQVPTSVTRRYDLANVILLVDTAQAPMQAACQALLKSVTSSGHERKLAVVFTHFDQMRGPNFSSAADKRNHVVASVEQAIQAVDDALESAAGGGRRLRRALFGSESERIFFVGSIQEQLQDGSKGTRRSLNALLSLLVAATRPEEPVEVSPGYDLAHLFISVRSATDQFQRHWNARLGLGYMEGVYHEHWKTIQALSRRFALQMDDKFRDLQPVAHLLALLQERLLTFVATPRDWEPSSAPAEQRDAAIERVARELFSRLQTYVSKRLREDQLNEWGTAFARRGTGSGLQRARDVRAINEVVAPVPGEAPTPFASRLLDDLRNVFREAVEAAGARIVA